MLTSISNSLADLLIVVSPESISTDRQSIDVLTGLINDQRNRIKTSVDRLNQFNALLIRAMNQQSAVTHSLLTELTELYTVLLAFLTHYSSSPANVLLLTELTGLTGETDQLRETIQDIIRYNDLTQNERILGAFGRMSSCNE